MSMVMVSSICMYMYIIVIKFLYLTIGFAFPLIADVILWTDQDNVPQVYSYDHYTKYKATKCVKG